MNLTGASAVILAAAAGCSSSNTEVQQRGATLGVEEILDRAADKMLGVRTLRAKGLMRDYRSAAKKVRSISWDYRRPDKCRLQIDLELAIISGRNWWTYDSRTERFKSHRVISKTPIETAGSLLSDGVRFLLPAVMRNGRAALVGRGGTRSGPWQLSGVDWIGSSPCYVVYRLGRGRDGNTRWSIWIDQDTFLIRAWSWDFTQPDGRERTIWGCTYFDISIDSMIPSERFLPGKPKPIILPRKDASVR